MLLAAVRKMRGLIANPHRWTQGFGARNKRGLSVPAGSVFATCWCIAGAMDRAMPSRVGHTELSLLMNSLVQMSGTGTANYVSFNDHNATTHADVMALLDTAEVFLLEACDPV